MENKQQDLHNIINPVTTAGVLVDLVAIGVGEGGRGALTPSPPKKKNQEKYFSCKSHAKFGHFVNFFGHISCKIREFC